MKRKQRAKEKLGYIFQQRKVPRGFFTEAEWKEYERRDEQGFLARFSNSMMRTYGFGVRKAKPRKRRK